MEIEEPTTAAATTAIQTNNNNVDAALNTNSLRLALFASREETRILKRQFFLFREDAKRRVEKAHSDLNEANVELKEADATIRQQRSSIKDNKEINATMANRIKSLERELAAIKKEN